MLRIFSKKSFQFDHPAGAEPAVTVQMQDFADVPDWVAKSAMFKLAKGDGDVEVIGSKKDEAKVENNASNPDDPNKTEK